jgi:hypothetical protein
VAAPWEHAVLVATLYTDTGRCRLPSLCGEGQEGAGGYKICLLTA